jgi:thiamine-phosphate pyrophosphorylase
VRRCLLAQARHAVDAGIDYLQIRERDLEAGALAELIDELVGLARGSSTRILVNDRFDVAIACGAAGVHLRGDSVPAAAIRRTAPPPFVVGVSVHSLDEAVAAAPSVDYIVAGTVWPTPSKAQDASARLLGVDGLARIAAAVHVPVLAIGGVTLERLPDAARAGAAGAAAIGLLMSDSADGEGCRARSLRAIVDTARAVFDTAGSAS